MVTLHFDVNNLSRTAFGGGETQLFTSENKPHKFTCMFKQRYVLQHQSALCGHLSTNTVGLFFLLFPSYAPKVPQNWKKKRQYCEFNNWHEEWDILSNPVSLPFIRFIDFLLTSLVDLYLTAASLPALCLIVVLLILFIKLRFHFRRILDWIRICSVFAKAAAAPSPGCCLPDKKKGATEVTLWKLLQVEVTQTFFSLFLSISYELFSSRSWMKPGQLNQLDIIKFLFSSPPLQSMVTTRCASPAS